MLIYQVKLWVMHATGFSMDALHMLVGMLLLITVAAVARRPLGSAWPWTMVLLVELANEANDLMVELWPDRAIQLGESAKDIFLTMALPSLLWAIRRHAPALWHGRDGD